MLWSQPRDLCLDLKALKEINLVTKQVKRFEAASPHNAFLDEMI